jgi:hypothetical protein
MMSTSPKVSKVVLFLFAGFLFSILGTAVVAGASTSALSVRPTTTTPTGTYFDHVVIIVMEDHGMIDICAQNPPPCSSSNGDPYTAILANSYGIGSHYLGVSHFSQADYVALLGGDVYGCVSYPCQPSSHANLVDRFEASGLTWRGYIENQAVASGCDMNYNEPYTPEHNPFVFFTDITNNAARCSNVVLANPGACSVTDCTLINDLNSAAAPNFMWVTPNNCDNMHGVSGICSTSIPLGDKYLSSLVPNILNSQTFTTQRSALFVVFDEGNGYCPLNNSSQDCMYAVWAGRGTKTGLVTSNLYDHYSFTKTIEVNWNLASLASNDASATAMTEFFASTALSASFAFSPASPTPSQTITFTATASGGTSPYAFNWSFGDGATGTGNPATHAYSTNGTYNAQLVVDDASGTTTTVSHSVLVTQPGTPDFSISSSPSSLFVTRGSSGTSTLRLTSLGGFAGTVTLSLAVSPSGPTVSVNPVTVTVSAGGSGTSTLTVSTQLTTPLGNYTVTETGNSGSLSHSATIQVAVRVMPDFSISGSPSSITLPRSSSGTFNLALTSLNGYSGTVNLSVSVSASGLRTSLSPTSVNLSPGGSGSSILTINTLRRIHLGTYVVTVTARSGSLSHIIKLTITVR